MMTVSSCTRHDSVEVRRPRPDEFGRVGELIYLVDPYIYPTLFGSAELAREVMPALMAVEHSPFAPEHVYLGCVDGVPAGVMVLFARPFEQLPLLEAFCEAWPELPESCLDVCQRYLLPSCEGVGEGEACILCVATDVAFRGRGVASALLRFAQEEAAKAGHTLLLDVLAENDNARRLYERCGFEVCGSAEGYSYEGKGPEVLSMRWQAE